MAPTSGITVIFAVNVLYTITPTNSIPFPFRPTVVDRRFWHLHITYYIHGSLLPTAVAGKMIDHLTKTNDLKQENHKHHKFSVPRITFDYLVRRKKIIDFNSIIILYTKAVL